MATKLWVYLAGPITGCNDDQTHWWRNEVKTRLGRQFEFEDPTEWADDRAVSQEISKLEACDIVLANMWKESIGTTLGIVRARQQGKPVILMDPNRINNATLNALVLPEVRVHSLDDACLRLRELVHEFKPFLVIKKDGQNEPFAPRKVARSVTSACAAAGVADAALEEHVTGPVIASLRREGGQRGSVTTQEIREAVFQRLKDMRTDFSLPTEIRSRCADIVKAWELHEKVAGVERTVRDAEESTARAQEEAESWKQVVRDLKRHPSPPPESHLEQEPAGPPRFRSADQMLADITRKWGAFLILHEEAKSSTHKIRPVLTARGLEDLHALMQRLGEFARDRAFAAVDGTAPPDLAERFGEKYAPTESHETKDRYRKGFCDHNGRKYSGLQHLKMTDEHGRPIRVYFDEISPAQFLVCEIGHRETYGHDG